MWVPGHWRPVRPAPLYARASYSWVGGFWRPEHRVGYRWVSSAFSEDGVFHPGYWEPIEDRPGHVWIPGWFDGREWHEGYWVPEPEYEATDPADWEPEPGWNDGWDEPDGPLDDDPPLALPVGWEG